MSLREKINKQFIAALKDKNKTLISTLRLILAAINERDIANRSGTNKEKVKDPEIIKVLKKMKKQRQDSADMYQKGGRQELQDAEKAIMPTELSGVSQKYKEDANYRYSLPKDLKLSDIESEYFDYYPMPK